MSTKTRKRMTEQRLERRLVEMFRRASTVASARTFEEEGILTLNKGVVVEFLDGSEFQVQVVDSTRR